MADTRIEAELQSRHAAFLTPARSAGRPTVALKAKRVALASLVGNMSMQTFLLSQRGLRTSADETETAADELARRILAPASEAPAPEDHTPSTSPPSSSRKLCTDCSTRGTSCAECEDGGQPRRKPKSGRGVASETFEHTPTLQGSGQPLSPEMRGFFEPRFGQDLSEVRVHDDTAAASTADRIGAHAFTLGQHIAFGAGEFRPDVASGRELIAHELAHVALRHSGIRPRLDIEAEIQYEVRERNKRIAEEQRKRHEAWIGSVEGQFGRDLSNQSKTIGEERERVEFGVTAQRSAAIDAVVSGTGWLNEALKAQGYAGPSLSDVKQSWGEAQVAAEALKLSFGTGTITKEAKIAGLQAIPVFYIALGAFAPAAEEAHRKHVQAENERRTTAYQAKLAQYNESVRMDRMSQGPRGEPGEAGFRLGQTLARGSPPDPPTPLKPPPGISTSIDAASARIYAADSFEEWKAVTNDVTALAAGFSNLIVASLPDDSDIKIGVQYLEKLEQDLAKFEQANPVAMRIPAMFYPNDRMISRKDEKGEPRLGPEAYPWQFYLINTGVTSYEQPAHSGGEWQLWDLTSPLGFKNHIPASDFDSARLQQGDRVDPPIELFTPLNAKIRFPEGRLYFTLPSGKSYVLKTTEPWGLTEWLGAIGMTLAAIALVAAVVATGGAATPAAVAFYASVGAAAAGIGSTLSDLHDKQEQGILTDADVDNAMISIAIDVATAASMGLGRLVAAPKAAARLGLIGERFIALQRVTQFAKGAVLAGDVYQAWTFTSGLVDALRAIDKQTGISDEERRRMKGQVARRALLTGVLLAVALRGDYHDVRAGSTLHATHVDSDGAIVAHTGEPAAHVDEAPHEHADAPDVSTTTHPAAPHTEVTGPVHAASGEAGTGIAVGAQSHALAAAGEGRARDLYFCSDWCTPLVHQLEAVLAVLPSKSRAGGPPHPERAVFLDLLSRARSAGTKLKAGKLTPEEVSAIERKISDDIARHSANSELFSALMNTDPAELLLHKARVREQLDPDAMITHAETQAERQEASRGSNRGRDVLEPRDPHSPLETDVLGGLSITERERPGTRLQPLKFDVGIFSHTYAEALVPGLQRGLAKEQRVFLANGKMGRADRVRYFRDADGDVIGVHVFEIKPNTKWHMDRGEEQAAEYLAGLKKEFEEKLRAKGKTPSEVLPDGTNAWDKQVLTYDRDKMRSVLRALRGSRRDAAQLELLEAIARQVFETPH